MDLSALLPVLSSLGPWGLVIGAVLTILVQRLNLKLPTLPSVPTTPATPTTPTTPSTPVLPDLLGISDRPILSLLLSLFKLKSTGAVTAADSTLLDMLHQEVGALKDSLKK